MACPTKKKRNQICQTLALVEVIHVFGSVLASKDLAVGVDKIDVQAPILGRDRAFRGAVAANGTATSAGDFDASAASEGVYTLGWRRPFAAPPLLLVSAGAFAVCHARDATRWQATVVCLAPGWEISADGHVVSLSLGSEGQPRGFPTPSPFTFLALLQ